MKNLYQHSIDLKKICIDNTDRDTFSRKLMNLPYRGYEVEELPDNRKIVITKPGGKNVYGTTQKEDFIVFIYNPCNDSLWQISHYQILDDIKNKVRENKDEAKKFLSLMERVYKGEEPEALIKAYKWIWGQEDVNYPTGKGRRMSWESYREIIKNL